MSFAFQKQAVFTGLYTDISPARNETRYQEARLWLRTIHSSKDNGHRTIPFHCAMTEVSHAAQSKHELLSKHRVKRVPTSDRKPVFML